jgi:hypothetical protein
MGLFSRKPVPAAPTPGPELAELRAQVGELAEAMRSFSSELADMDGWRGDINQAVAEGIKHVDRVENRIRATVRRAREQLADHGYEHPGLEAEAQELRRSDGAGGREEGVPPVRGDVANGVQTPQLSMFPGGFPAEWVAQMRGH